MYKRQACVLAASPVVSNTTVASVWQDANDTAVWTNVTEGSILLLSTRSDTQWRCIFVHRGLNTGRKVLPYSLPSVGPGADPGVQAVSPQVTV